MAMYLATVAHFEERHRYYDAKIASLEASLAQEINDSRAGIKHIADEFDKVTAGMSEGALRTVRVTNATNIIRETRNNSISESDAIRLANMIYDAADRNGIPYALLMAIISTESRFNASVNSSSAGAKGLCQIMPTTFTYIARANGLDYSDKDITDPYKNLRIGSIYIRDLSRRHNGSVDLIAAGYNGGPKVAANYKLYMAGDTSVYIPAETIKYVESVKNNMNNFNKYIGE